MSDSAMQTVSEKHRDFWVGVADFVLDHEDELAEQLDIPDIDT